MTAPAELSARLAELSAQLLSVPREQLRADARLADDLGVDSLAAIEWGMAIEDAFGVALPEDVWEHVRSYGAVEQLVRQLAHPGV